MYTLLNLSTLIFTIVFAILPAIGHPALENESLFDSDSEPLEPLPNNEIGNVDAFYTDQDPMTDVLALAPLFTENPDLSFQAPTDAIGTDAPNSELLGSLDPPLLLAAGEDWDWDCPAGKESFCCSERGVTILVPTDFGDCRNLRNREVKDKTCHPELRACCVSVHFLSGVGKGCEEAAVAFNGIQWPDIDLRGFIENTKGLGIGVWELIHDKV